MTIVGKFPTPLDDEVTISVPPGSTFLSVQNQQESLCFWYIISPELEATKEVHLCIRGTGHPMNGWEGKFLGTVQFAGGSLVFHVFRKSSENWLNKELAS